MGYIIALLMLFTGGVLGKVVAAYLGLKKTKHTLVYGLFAYFAGFFILSGPFTFLQLHWNLYFIVMTCYNLAIACLLIYAYSKKIITVEFSAQAILDYVKSNGLVFAMIIFFILLNLASNNILAGGATGDDIAYLSWASKHIGGQIYPVKLDPISGSPDKLELVLLLSFLELFWGYMSQAFSIDLVVFARTTMAIVTYVWFFYTVDEVIYVWTDKKQYERFKYTILAAGLMYYVDGMQSEVYKFMYNPWFGNVFSLMMYLPLLLLFFWHSLRNKKSAVLLGLLPFISAGFSPVSILHVGLTIIPITFLWYKNKTYHLRNERKLIYISFGMALLFLAVSIIPDLFHLRSALFVPGGWHETVLHSEMAFFHRAFASRLLFMLPGIVIFFYRLGRKQVGTLEKWFVLFGLSLLLIGIIPAVDQAVFIVFSFPLRRVLESYMMAFVFYSVAMVLRCFSQVKWQQLLLAFALCSLIFYRVPGFYFLNNAGFKANFNIHNVLVEKRFAPVVSDLEDFLLTHSEERTNVCIWDEREVQLNDGVHRADLALAIAPVPNAYYNCNVPANDQGHLYYVTHKPEELAATYGEEHLKLLTTIETDELTIEVYQYV